MFFNLTWEPYNRLLKDIDVTLTRIKEGISEKKERI